MIWIWKYLLESFIKQINEWNTKEYFPDIFLKEPKINDCYQIMSVKNNRWLTALLK